MFSFSSGKDVGSFLKVYRINIFLNWEWLGHSACNRRERERTQSWRCIFRRMSVRWETEGLQTVGIVCLVFMFLKLMHLLGLIDITETGERQTDGKRDRALSLGFIIFWPRFAVYLWFMPKKKVLTWLFSLFFSFSFSSFLYHPLMSLSPSLAFCRLCVKTVSISTVKTNPAVSSVHFFFFCLAVLSWTRLCVLFSVSVFRFVLF